MHPSVHNNCSYSLDVKQLKVSYLDEYEERCEWWYHYIAMKYYLAIQQGAYSSIVLFIWSCWIWTLYKWIIFCMYAFVIWLFWSRYTQKSSESRQSGRLFAAPLTVQTIRFSFVLVGSRSLLVYFSARDRTKVSHVQVESLPAMWVRRDIEGKTGSCSVGDPLPVILIQFLLMGRAVFLTTIYKASYW